MIVAQQLITCVDSSRPAAKHVYVVLLHVSLEVLRDQTLHA